MCTPSSSSVYEMDGECFTSLLCELGRGNTRGRGGEEATAAKETNGEKLIYPSFVLPLSLPHCPLPPLLILLLVGRPTQQHQN